MKESDVPKKLLWVDLEMTGLDPAKQKIIEVAAVVTDFAFQELGQFEAIVHQPDSVLETAEEWPKQHMQQLFSEVRSAKQSDAEVQAAFAAFIARHFTEPAVLAGNSIHQDRRFIRSCWPDIDALLHYRMFDVSSFKIWVQATKQEEYEKGEGHRAMEDIRESIEELKWASERL